jgi:Lar family restriction alleviation protein
MDEDIPLSTYGAIDDLLPCPFCGSTDIDVYPDYPVYVKCNVCGACGPQARDSGNEWALAKVTEAWNRRAKLYP